MSAPQRPVDPTAGYRVQKIGPGGLRVTRDAGEMIVTVLGSCVAVCMRDEVAAVGGMNHFMLPNSGQGGWDGLAGRLRYGDFAIPRLIEDILRRGGQRDRLEVKLFGASQIGKSDVGIRNAQFAKTFLASQGLRASATDLGGHAARRVAYHPGSGRAFILELHEAPVGESPIS